MPRNDHDERGESSRDEFGRVVKSGEGNHDRDLGGPRDYDRDRRGGRHYDSNQKDHWDDRQRNGDGDENGGPRESERGRRHEDDRRDSDRRRPNPYHDQRDATRNNDHNIDQHYGPAKEFDEDLYPGLVVSGEVARIEVYGAFVDFRDPKFDRPHRGLVHISQIASQRVEQVSDILKLRDKVYVVVLEVEFDPRRGPHQRRIRLSMKDVDQESGEYRGPNLSQQNSVGRRGRPPPPRELQQRAQQRRDIYLDFAVDWQEGSKEWSRKSAPGYLRTLWSPSPEPPSQSITATAKKKEPPKRDNEASDSESSSSSSTSDSSSSASSSSYDRRRRRGKKRSRHRRSRDHRKRSHRRRRRDDSSSKSSSSSSSSSSSGSNSRSSSESQNSRDAKKPKLDDEAAKESVAVEMQTLNEAEAKDAEDLKSALQGAKPAHDDDEEEGPMPLPQSNAATGGATQDSSAYGKALLPGEGQAIAQYVQQNLRIPRRGEIGYSGDDVETFEQSGYVMSGSRHKRMNAVRIRKENQVYSAEEQRALALITMEENQQKEAQLMEDFRTMLKEKQKMREKG